MSHNFKRAKCHSIIVSRRTDVFISTNITYNIRLTNCIIIKNEVRKLRKVFETGHYKYNITLID